MKQRDLSDKILFSFKTLQVLLVESFNGLKRCLAQVNLIKPLFYDFIEKFRTGQFWTGRTGQTDTVSIVEGIPPIRKDETCHGPYPGTILRNHSQGPFSGTIPRDHSQGTFPGTNPSDLSLGPFPETIPRKTPRDFSQGPAKKSISFLLFILIVACICHCGGGLSVHRDRADWNHWLFNNFRG